MSIAETAERLAKNLWVRLTLTAILVGFIIWRIDPPHMASAAGHLGLRSLLLAAVLTIPFLLLKAMRWQYILRAGGLSITLREATISLIGGMGVALLTPARVGELARVAYLPPGSKLRQAGLVMLDKFFDVLVLVLLSIAGAWVIIGWWFGLILVVAGLVGLVVTLFPRSFEKPVGSLEVRMPLGGKTKEVFGSLESLGLRSTTLFIGLTFASFVIVILQFWIILNSLHAVSPNVAALTFPMVILTNVLPITIAGLGVREGASIALLHPYGVSAWAAAISAFAMFVVNTALPGLAGAFLPLFRHDKPVVSTPTEHRV